MKFKEKLREVITLWMNWLPDPEDEVQLGQWMIAAETIADSVDWSDQEDRYIDLILDKYEDQWKKAIMYHRNQGSSNRPTRETLDALLNQKQTEQRTQEWYDQMATILSASELGNLFASARQRAIMVVAKTKPPPVRYQQLAVPSERMNPFDWGIRFEPVVKQIYEHKYGAVVKELGRLRHPTDPRCMASPDGLVYQSVYPQRVGRLVEIKCPVTREIDGTVPKDYYAQMQMQLQVSGLHECDYIEAVFSSAYKNMEMKQGPCLYDGVIALVQKVDHEFYYIYGPLHALDWDPPIKEGEEVVEIIPWRLYQWDEQVVMRNDEWWKGLQPMIDAFWEDVEKSKRNEFVVPDSTRAPRAKKQDSCMIQFHKLDEDGNHFS
jgi:hypothetical protein